jgi:hypothetical protein
MTPRSLALSLNDSLAVTWSSYLNQVSNRLLRQTVLPNTREISIYSIDLRRVSGFATASRNAQQLPALPAGNFHQLQPKEKRGGHACMGVPGYALLRKKINVKRINS